MSLENNTPIDSLPKKSGVWSELIRKEDWWSVWIGLFLVAVSILFWLGGHSIKIFTAQILPWSNLQALTSGFSSNIGSILLLFLVLFALFAISVSFQGVSIKTFTTGFILLFVLSVFVNILSSWKWASQYNLEAPLLALIIGLIIGNVIKIPAWFESALRTELYVKVGIVLMGATLPFTLIIKAGPIAFLQATIIAVITFLIIYFVGSKWLGLDKRFAATLGAGGSICGVSAAIAVGGAIKTKKEYVSITISLVVIYAIVFIFLLSFLIKLLGIQAGPAGAWIGTSEFADAAGITAASSFGDKALASFTLMKVIGRDIFIGIWSFVLAFISITLWEKRKEGEKAQASQIFYRFPKFVIGFFLASILITVIIVNVSASAQAIISTDVIAPIKTLRTWAFTFTFLSIGLTTRFKDLTSVGWRPAVAFGAGAFVNVILGYLLSIVLLNSFWSNI